MYYLSFAFVMLAPIAMLVVGVRWYLKPPEFKAPGLAYRTEVTERSPELWYFAHTHCGKLWARFGAMLAVIFAVLMVLLRSSYHKYILWMFFAQMLVLTITIFMIDYLSRGLFDENGVRIQNPNAPAGKTQAGPDDTAHVPAMEAASADAEQMQQQADKPQ